MSFSFNVIDSSSGDPPIRDSRHRRAAAGAASRWTRSTIDGTEQSDVCIPWQGDVDCVWSVVLTTLNSHAAQRMRHGLTL